MFIDDGELRQAIERGVLTGSTGDNVFNTATRSDLAEAAASRPTTSPVRCINSPVRC